ncbi:MULTISPECIES: glycosyltransferase family 9 protein [Tatumella]|uniref:Glycosyltransferase family 9 protein n=1 Tax=Tatumella punctata TaxID=399969 RepID=A0ABW1VNU7_9GAMM|nr:MULTISPECIES: glycosyltransferase family 9 protein [unclassified Tatumella]MBS0856611.1 glycosyltransferase family 9 protein [Tatumella sp. JGM16]MBS0893845.1 glycosyltransferase family 9 protein [Tatumella sp. JGM130]MBS0913465.1 glycosyltransferase family 9 protein [Tatumella sp. JGM91]
MWKKVKYWNRQKNHLLRRLKLKLVCMMFDMTCRPTAPDLKAIKKVLVLRDDNKIGDMIVSTGLFDQLHSAGLRVDVVAGNANAFIAESLPQVSAIFLYPQKILQILQTGCQLRRQKYDLVIDFGDYLSPVYYSFISLINARHTLGFNKPQFCRYDLNVTDTAIDQHITTRYKKVLAMLGLPSDTYRYQLQVPDIPRREANAFIHSLPSDAIVVLNPFAASKDRMLSPQQISAFTRMVNQIAPELQVIVIGPPDLLAATEIPVTAIKNPCDSFWSAVVLVQRARLLISPDTSWVHVACAYQTPLIALYKSKIIDGGLINNKVWAPGFQPSVQIITDKNSVADIEPQAIAGALKQYLRPAEISEPVPRQHTDKTV